MAQTSVEIDKAAVAGGGAFASCGLLGRISLQRQVRDGEATRPPPGANLKLCRVTQDLERPNKRRRISNGNDAGIWQNGCGAGWKGFSFNFIPDQNSSTITLEQNQQLHRGSRDRAITALQTFQGRGFESGLEGAHSQGAAAVAGISIFQDGKTPIRETTELI